MGKPQCLRVNVQINVFALFIKKILIRALTTARLIIVINKSLEKIISWDTTIIVATSRPQTAKCIPQVIECIYQFFFRTNLCNKVNMKPGATVLFSDITLKKYCSTIRLTKTYCKCKYILYMYMLYYGCYATLSFLTLYEENNSYLYEF